MAMLARAVRVSAAPLRMDLLRRSFASASASASKSSFISVGGSNTTGQANTTTTTTANTTSNNTSSNNTRSTSAPALKWTLESSVSSFPLHKHRSNEHRPLDCGEDAFFIFENEHTCAAGVADGVGGWAEVGVDPSLFAWGLMEACQRVCERAVNGALPGWEVLQQAHRDLMAARTVKAGSSTACVVTVDRASGRLRGANLGDSGLYVLRNKSILFHSTEQQHDFNAPYQLSMQPPGQQGQLAVGAEHADKIELDLQDGDLLILATDGLLDNLFPEDVTQLVSHHPTRDVHGLASALMQHARKLSTDKAYMSPFATRLHQYYKARARGYRGGKEDDITVVVALVRKPQLQARL